MDHNVDVVEVTFCNSISVAEHVVMMILSLVRNYIPSYMQVVNGGTLSCLAMSPCFHPGFSVHVHSVPVWAG